MATTTPYRVLARKYRPQTLAELVGQDVLVKTLTHGIQTNKLPHAFIFHGIRGVGKTTTARIIAKALNCTGPDGQGGPTPNPCGVCSSCVSIQEDRHLDVVEMDAASRTGVDDIREVIESARYKAVSGRYKIYIIDEVHMLSRNAFNALLKTLEEPPPHVKFIFATTELKKVPDTVLSRCMRFDLGRISPNVLLNHFSRIAKLENVAIDTESLALITRAADGSARDGLSLLDQAIALCGETVSCEVVRQMLGVVDRGRLFEVLTLLMQGNVEPALTQARDLVASGGDPTALLQDLLDLIYWVTCLKNLPKLQSDITWPEKDRQQGAQLAESLSMAALIRAWQVLSKGYEEVTRSPLPGQAMEMVLMRLCYLSDLPSAENLLAVVQNGGRMPQLAQAAPVEASKTLPNTYQELMAVVAQAKEPIIYSHLIHDVHLLDYKPGYLKMRLSDAVMPTFSAQLQTVLERVTGQSWQIDLSQEKGAPTVREQRIETENQHREEALNHPIVKSLQEDFPESLITVKVGVNDEES